MSRTSVPARLDDRSYWKRLLATCHPDKTGGDHELFLFLQGLREHVEGCCEGASPRSYEARSQSYATGSERTGGDQDRLAYDEQLGFVDEHVQLTLRALSIGQRKQEPYRSTLGLLLDCPSQEHGRLALRQCREASWKQVALAAHLAEMDKVQRLHWYEICRSIPLSEAHGHHLISRLKERREEAA